MQANYEYWRDNYSSPCWWHSENNVCTPHFHSSIELTYVTEGEVKAVLNGKTYFLKKNHILIAPSYTVHYHTTEEYSKSIVLIIPLDFVPMYAKMFENKSFVKNTCIENSDDSEIAHCLKVLTKSNNTTGEGINNTVVKGYIYVILGLLIEKLGLCDVPENQKGDLAKEILIYLQNNFLTPLTLESVASHFGYSKSRFSHIFNSLFGCGINPYISSLRCRNAATLLVEDSIPIIDAAMNSGFDSMRTFYRSFKSWFGITPSEYCENFSKKYNSVCNNENRCYTII